MSRHNCYLTERQHTCYWTERQAETAYHLIKKQEEVDQLRRQVNAADAKKNKMAENCYYYNAGQCRADNNRACKQQCGLADCTIDHINENLMFP